MPSDKVVKKLADIIKTDHRKNRLLVELEEISVARSKIPQPPQDGRQNFDYKNYPELDQVVSELGDVLGMTFDQIPGEADLDKLKATLTKIPELVVEYPKKIEYLTNESSQNTTALLDQITVAIGGPTIMFPKPTSDFLAGVALSYKGSYVNMSLDKLIKEKLYG